MRRTPPGREGTGSKNERLYGGAMTWRVSVRIAHWSEAMQPVRSGREDRGDTVKPAGPGVGVLVEEQATCAAARDAREN